MHEEVLDTGEESVGGEVEGNSMQCEVDFAQPRGTESKRAQSDNESASLFNNSCACLTEQNKERGKNENCNNSTG